jgi:hypothetical protein
VKEVDSEEQIELMSGRHLLGKGRVLTSWLSEAFDSGFKKKKKKKSSGSAKGSVGGSGKNSGGGGEKWKENAQWARAIAPNGKSYYYDKVTKRTQWDVPDDWPYSTDPADYPENQG